MFTVACNFTQLRYKTEEFKIPVSGLTDLSQKLINVLKFRSILKNRSRHDRNHFQARLCGR